MHREFLKYLKCPYSGSSLVLRNASVSSAGDVQYGILVGEMLEFPILGGIVRLIDDELRIPTLRELRKGDNQRALMIALESPFHDRKSAVANALIRQTIKTQSTMSSLLLPLRRSLYHALQHCDSFVELMDEIGNGFHGEWQKYRFSMETFLPMYALLPLAGEDRTAPYVLDFACGLGHGSHLLALKVGGERMVCADNSFTSLYIAKKYFVPAAMFVCVDGNGSLPFVNKMFANVYCSDALHFISAKAALAVEFCRVLSPGGTVVIAHVHNKASAVPSGTPLSIKGYRNLFPLPHVRIVADQVLIRELLEAGELRLDQHGSAVDIQTMAQGISVVASHDDVVYRRYSNIWELLMGSTCEPIVNPVYRQEHEMSDGTMQLRKTVSDDFRTRVERYIKNYAVEQSEIRRDMRSDTPGDSILRLFKQFVFVPAPQHYTATVRMRGNA